MYFYFVTIFILSHVRISAKISKHLNYLFNTLQILSGDSGNCDKLYFFIYESPNKVVERLEVSINPDDKDVEKSSDTLDFESFVKKMGFYQRYQK